MTLTVKTPAMAGLMTTEEVAAILDQVAEDVAAQLQPTADDPQRSRKAFAVSIAKAAIKMQADWWRRMGQAQQLQPFQARIPRGASLS